MVCRMFTKQKALIFFPVRNIFVIMRRRGPNPSAGNRKSRSRSKYKTDSSSRHHGTQPKSSTEKQQLDRVDLQG